MSFAFDSAATCAAFFTARSDDSDPSVPTMIVR
jgi:hypothetical protein